MRETGEVRKRLSGEEAAPYIGAARTLLGILKNDMSFNSLLQGWRKQTLADGVVISVRSIFGQDTINIFKPVPEIAAPTDTPFEYAPPQEEVAVGEPPEWDVEATAQGLVACGQYNVLSGTSLVPRPYKWTRQAGMVDLAMPAGASQASPVGISGNGARIVGSATIAGSNVAVVWDRATPSVIPGSGAFGVSASGGSVGVVATVGICRWSASGGLVVVASSAGLFYPDTPKMSRDGNYIISSINDYPNYVGRVWASNGQVFSSPLVGYRGIGVSDVGVALLYRNNDDAALWNIHSGAIETFTGFNSVAAISSDGRNVVGRWSTDNSAAAWRDGAGVITVLDPGPQTFVSSGGMCVDAFAGNIIIGGYAALTGKTDNHAPNANEAMWTARSGAAVLERISPSPNAYEGNGGYISALAIPRVKVSDGTSGADVVVL